MTLKYYVIEPVDSWFFRDALPFDVAGGNSLASQFPPTARTVFSALYTARQEAEGVDWFDRDSDQTMEEQQGIGPYLISQDVKGKWMRLYPLPLTVLKKKDSKHNSTFTCLSLDKNSDPVYCDIGKVLMPRLDLPAGQEDNKGYKPMEQAWVTVSGFQKILEGLKPDHEDIMEIEHLFKKENRIGLARDNTKRTALEGMLYETGHLRLIKNKKQRVTLGASLRNTNWEGGITRFGGEGRMAVIEAIDQLQEYQVVSTSDNKKPEGIILYLLTPARFGRSEHKYSEQSDSDYEARRRLNREPARHIPPGLDYIKGEKHDIWKGTMPFIDKEGKKQVINLTVHSAVIGKGVREGGWKIGPYQNEARSVRSYLPAGSLWYCTLDDPNITYPEAIERLNHAHIGDEWELGRGELAVGLWF